MMRRTTIIEIIVVLNIILFLYTGIAKLMEYSLFKEQLAVSPILGFAAEPVAVLLPWVEFLIVILLVVPRWRLKGVYASLGLMAAFTLYITAMFIFAKDLPCSCGGIIELLSWKQHLVFNMIFVLLDAVAIRLLRKEKSGFTNDWNEQQGYKITHG